MKAQNGLLGFMLSLYRIQSKKEQRKVKVRENKIKAANKKQEQDQKLALKRYNILISYLIYENVQYWQRFYLFLITESILLGAILARLPSQSSDVLQANGADATLLVIFSAVTTVGAYIAFLCQSVLKHAEVWIERWIRCLSELEPKAYGEMYVMRHEETKQRPPSTKKSAHAVLFVIQAVWLLYAIYIYYQAMSIDDISAIEVMAFIFIALTIILTGLTFRKVIFMPPE